MSTKHTNDNANTTDVPFVPVTQEPLHREVWKNDHVRLVHVQFPPHTTCRWHQHVKFGIYICIHDISATEQPRNDAEHALVKSKGDVFCRDHTLDKLIHVVSTQDTPLDIIEVELLHDKSQLVPHDDVPQHVARGVRCLHDALESRVYRIELLTMHTEDVTLTLPTSAVLVALDACVVTIFNPTGDSADMLADERQLAPSDAVPLVAGQFEIKLVRRDHPESVAFVLAEVF